MLLLYHLYITSLNQPLDSRFELDIALLPGTVRPSQPLLSSLQSEIASTSQVAARFETRHELPLTFDREGNAAIQLRQHFRSDNAISVAEGHICLRCKTVGAVGGE